MIRKIYFSEFLVLFLYVILVNSMVTSATLLLHELGHYTLGLYEGCEKIKFVLLDSEQGTYTEMVCPRAESWYFAVLGAFVFVIPYSILFIFLKNFPERHLSMIIIGFNFLIASADFSFFPIINPIVFCIGVILIIWKEIIFIDNLLNKFLVRTK